MAKMQEMVQRGKGHMVGLRRCQIVEFMTQNMNGTAYVIGGL